MLCTESEVTANGLKKRTSELDVIGLARAPPAKDRAVEEAARRPFILIVEVRRCAERK
jgi:hypothetical protein